MTFADPQRTIDQFGIPEGARVADLGSGAGFYSLAAAKKVGLDGRVYSVDIQQDLLTMLQGKARDEGISNIEIIRGDLEQLGGTKIRDNFVDVAIVSNVFFQLEDKAVFLKEVYRLLRPGGRLLFVDWSESFGGMGPEPQAVVPMMSAKKALEENGFEFVSDIDAGDHHYAMTFKKPK